MSKLILTDEEKAMPIMETPDKPLADCVRHVYALMQKPVDNHKPFMAAAAQHLCVFAAVEVNADTFTSTIEGLSFQDKPLGNWKVTVEKISD